MNIIKSTKISKTQPENMRVVRVGRTYAVQTQSKSGEWVSQKEHKCESLAINDLDSWY